MTIHIVLPVHNRRVMTLAFLDSLAQQTIDEPVTVVLVDDGSTDGTAQAVASWCEAEEHASRIRLRAIRGSGDLWWAGAVRRALEEITPDLEHTDWVYLGNNDTVLDPDHLRVLRDTAVANPGSIVGARSFEIWQDGHRHPVSAGFRLDPSMLEVSNIPGDAPGVIEVQALAGRGVLMPAGAARRVRMHPGAMPQHFADLAMTSALRRAGWRLLVDHDAASDQLERAGSSVELQPRLADFTSKRSQLYLPAVFAFWWLQSSAGERVTLPFRFLARGIRQLRGGAYAVT